LIDILDRRSKRGEKALAALSANPDESMATTSINLHELLYGCLKHSKPTDRLFDLQVLPFSKTDAALSSKIEAGLDAAGTSAQRADAMIAAVAINSGGRLFTFNVAHFELMTGYGLKLFA
jgi:tRNA(fMet)-specific endonuclease VapC